jgi:protein-disulfide isomerase
MGLLHTRLGRFGLPMLSIGLTLAILMLGHGPSSPSVAAPANVYKVPVSASDPALGSAEPLVTIVGFFDLSCQFSRATYLMLRQMMKEQGAGDVRVVFKHRPILPDGKGRRAAMLVERARRSGKFWEAVDASFGKLGDLDDPGLVATMAKLGVSLDHLPVTSLAPSEDAIRLRSDLALARRLGVAATPTIFVNGERFNGAISPMLLREAVTRHRGQAVEVLKKSGARSELYDQLVGSGRDRRQIAPFRFPGAHGGAPFLNAVQAQVAVSLFCDNSCQLCRRMEDQLRQAAHDTAIRLELRNFLPGGVVSGRDAALAARLGIARVPTMFINGKAIVGVLGRESLMEEMEAELDGAVTRAVAETESRIDSPALVDTMFPEVTPRQAFDAWVNQRLERSPACGDPAGPGGHFEVQAMLSTSESGFRLDGLQMGSHSGLSANEVECLSRTLKYTGMVRLPAGAALRSEQPVVPVSSKMVLESGATRAQKRRTCQ